VKISIDQAPKWVTELEGKMHQAALRGLRAAGQRLVGHIQNVVIPGESQVPVDRGTYRAAWRSTNAPDGCLVHNDAPHAVFIEDGVRDENVKIGRRMIDALASWVRRKGIVADAPRGSRGVAARQIAFAIAQSMKKRGIFGGKGLKILKKGRARVPDFIAEEVEREINAIRR